MNHIHNYYSPNDLYNKIIEGLNEIGKDLSKVTFDDLQPVDESHIQGEGLRQTITQLAHPPRDNCIGHWNQNHRPLI